MAQRPVRTTTQERSGARQRALVDAAARLLIEHGPAAVTHRRVAEEAGVPAGSANYYFPSKAVLYAEAVRTAEDLRGRGAQAYAEALPARPRTARETARLLVEAFYAPGLSADVVSVRLEPMLAAQADPELRSIMVASRPRLLDALRVVLRRCGHAQVAAGPDVDLVAQMIDASLLYAGLAGEPDPVEVATGSVARLLELAGRAADPE
jgi:AcrR family transcriptional regulator